MSLPENVEPEARRGNLLFGWIRIWALRSVELHSAPIHSSDTHIYTPTWPSKAWVDFHPSPARVWDPVSTWRRRSELNRNSGFFRNQLLRYYHPATRGVHPHNYRTPIESAIFECVSITRHNKCNTNQLIAAYSATTRSLALSP